MTTEQLIEEATQLVRACVYLTQDDADAPLAAVWGGSGLVALPTDKSGFPHWLSLDCRFLPKGYDQLTGCLSVYVNEEEEQGIVAADHRVQLASPPASGVALFAHPGSSWPPINAIFRFGSSAVKAWMAECNWQPQWLYNDNFKDYAIVGAYEEHVREHNPLFGGRDDVFAMLGGWHESWPENDWADLLNKQLVVFTYHDAEPWIEVWADDQQNFQVIQRIS